MFSKSVGAMAPTPTRALFCLIYHALIVIFFSFRPKKKVNLNLIICQQCEFQYSQKQIELQPNGENLCQYCVIGKTDPFKVLKMFNDQTKILPLENDAIKLQKQTGLSFGEITQWFTSEMQRISNDFDGIPDFESDSATVASDSLNDTKESLSDTKVWNSISIFQNQGCY